MYQLNSRLSFNEEQLLAHIPPEHTGEKYIVNKLRCMDYIAKHYTSLEQQIHNIYEIDQDFFFFCTPKTIFSLFFWSDSPDCEPAFVAISIDSEKTKSLGTPHYNIELHCTSLKFVFDDVMPTLRKHILEICSNLKTHFTASPDELNFLTLYESEYLTKSLDVDKFNLKMALPMFQYSQNVCISSYMKQYGDDLLFNKPFENAPLFLESFVATHLFNVSRGQKTPLMQLYYDIQNIGSKLYESKLLEDLAKRQFDITNEFDHTENITNQLDDFINELTIEIDELKHYTFNELKPSLFGIPFKHTFSEHTAKIANEFEKEVRTTRTKDLKTCFVQPIFVKHHSWCGFVPDERYIVINRLMHIDAINNFIDNYHKHKATIYKNLSGLSKLIQENPSECDILISTHLSDKITHFTERFNEIDTKLSEELDLILSHFKDIEVI